MGFIKMFKKIKLIVAGSLLISIFAVTAVPGFVAADVTCPTGQVNLQGDSNTCCPTGAASSASSCLYAKYVNPFIALLSAAVGIVIVIGIIVGAIQFSSSAGDPQKAAAGKNHIRNALLGLVAYLLLYAFLQFIIPGGKLNG